MHKEKTRLFLQHMTMDGSHLNAVLPQRVDHRIHFASDENEISSDCCFAYACRLEIQRRCQSHGTGYGHASFRHLLGPGHANLVDASIRLPLVSENLVDGRSVEIN